MEQALYLHNPLFRNLLFCQGQSSAPELWQLRFVSRMDNLFWSVWISFARELRRNSQKFLRRNFQTFPWLSSRFIFPLNTRNCFDLRSTKSWWRQKRRGEKEKKIDWRLQTQRLRPKRFRSSMICFLWFHCFRRRWMRAVELFLIC